MTPAKAAPGKSTDKVLHGIALSDTLNIVMTL